MARGGTWADAAGGRETRTEPSREGVESCGCETAGWEKQRQEIKRRVMMMLEVRRDVCGMEEHEVWKAGETGRKLRQEGSGRVTASQAVRARLGERQNRRGAGGAGGQDGLRLLEKKLEAGSPDRTSGERKPRQPVRSQVSVLRVYRFSVI